MLCRGLVGVVLLVALLGLLAAHTWTGYTARRPPRVALVLFGGRFESLELTGKSIIQVSSARVFLCLVNSLWPSRT